MLNDKRYMKEFLKGKELYLDYLNWRDTKIRQKMKERNEKIKRNEES